MGRAQPQVLVLLPVPQRLLKAWARGQCAQGCGQSSGSAQTQPPPLPSGVRPPGSEQSRAQAQARVWLQARGSLEPASGRAARQRSVPSRQESWLRRRAESEPESRAARAVQVCALECEREYGAAPLPAPSPPRCRHSTLQLDRSPHDSPSRRRGATGDAACELACGQA